jgi:hypothetical protein
MDQLVAIMAGAQTSLSQYGYEIYLEATKRAGHSETAGT